MGDKKMEQIVVLAVVVSLSIWLSLISCSLTTVISLWVAVPIGYVMSRCQDRETDERMEPHGRPSGDPLAAARRSSGIASSSSRAAPR